MWKLFLVRNLDICNSNPKFFSILEIRVNALFKSIGSMTQIFISAGTIITTSTINFICSFKAKQTLHKNMERNIYLIAKDSLRTHLIYGKQI